MKKYICAILVLSTLLATAITAEQIAAVPYSLAQYQQKKISAPTLAPTANKLLTKKTAAEQRKQAAFPTTPSAMPSPTPLQKALSVVPKIPSGKSMVSSILKTMSAIKQYMSPSQWWSIMTQFVGSLFLKFWSSVWDVVRDGLASVVGVEKIYALANDGSIKIDRNGRKQPRLIAQFSLNEEGESIKEMVPTKWFNVLEDPNSLLGLLVTSGIDGSVEATFKSLDRLFFRPFASTVLNIPLWKLSHVHYQLAMTELQNPGTPVVNPKALTGHLLKNKNPGRLITSNFPFNLRAIVSAKDNQEKMLMTGITQHLWTIYQPIWQELEKNITISRENDTAAGNKKITTALTNNGATQYTGTPMTKAQVFGDKLLDEAKTIGIESIRSKVMEGPIAPYMAYAQLALKIPQAIFGAQFNTQPATELIGNNGQALSEDLTKNIMIAIDICDALAAKARSRNLEIADDKELDEMVWVTHGSGERTLYKIHVRQDLVTKLLTSQEQGLREYLPFCSNFAGEPYDRYIMKLLMPRLIIKCIPAALREELGIYNYADAAASIELIKNKFNVTFKSLTAISSLMAMIKKFEGTRTFAGRYVEIADTFDRCLQDLSALVQSVYPTPKDPWQKRIVTLARRSVIGRNTADDLVPPGFFTSYLFVKQAPAFSTTQKSRLNVAAQKSGYTNPILAFDRTSIINYINRDNVDKIKLIADRTAINDAVRRQKTDKKLSEYQPDDLPLSYGDLLEMLNDWYNGSTKTPITVLANNKENRTAAIDRAYKIILHTFGLLSLNQAAKVDLFFTADANTTAKTSSAIAKDYKKFTDKMNDNLILAVSNIQEFVSVFHNFYTTYGLREIITALDEHYRLTGQKGKDIPLKVFAKIALKEGSSHLVGYGAEKLLKGALNQYVLPRISALQSTGIIGGNVVNQMLNKHLDMILGTVNGRTSAYHASRELIKNIFDYGASTALNPTNIMGAVGSKFIPAQFGGNPGTSEYASLMTHAKMAAESGKAPSPLIAQRLKKMGIDPDNLPKETINMDFSDTADFDEEAFLRALKREK